MRRLALILFCGIVTAKAADIPPQYAERVVDAIYWVEGGDKARKPYGVLSVRVGSKEEARRVCLNTVRNNWRRWESAGRPGHYLNFLAARYCPPSADPKGHANWRRNIHALVK